jgi:ABC-type nitrate/sulfonate/bicarbonate transport system ATPase subunit
MLVKVENLSFGYNESRAILKNISFSVNGGDTLGLLGVSGCGKSTLMRVLSGVLADDSPHILSGSVEIDGTSPREYRRAGKLSFMFQEPTLLPQLSVRKNIELPFSVRGINKPEKVEEVIDVVGLSDYVDYLPHDLSGGMKTRVSLARSFVTGPELLLLDEPFSALDVGWKAKLYDELMALQRNYKTTVILVTHDIEEALELSHRVLLLGIRGDVLGHYTVDSNNQLLAQEIRAKILADHNSNLMSNRVRLAAKNRPA